jgi:hypothetical protein
LASRLKQIYFDGQFEYSKVVSIDFEKENKTVINPNPVDENLFIGNIKNIEGDRMYLFTTFKIGW